MGTFIGHILPGAGFLLLGLWHLYNTMGGYVRTPWHHKARTWFSPPGFPLLRHAELYFIMVGACLSIAGELFIPWPDSFAISTHLNNYEHSTISLTLFIYAAFALAADVLHVRVPQGGLHAAAALALGQELLLFHFHSADHMGLEGHYHWLLQLPVAAGVLALLVEIVVLHVPVIAVLRSMSLVLQGTWFLLMGFILWTPALLPEGCTRADDVVQCADAQALERAKSLANLEFSWLLAGILVLTGFVYVAVSALAKHAGAYQHLDPGEHSEGPGFKGVEDMENGRASPLGGSQASMELQGFDGLDLER